MDKYIVLRKKIPVIGVADWIFEFTYFTPIEKYTGKLTLKPENYLKTQKLIENPNMTRQLPKIIQKSKNSSTIRLLTKLDENYSTHASNEAIRRNVVHIF